METKPKVITISTAIMILVATLSLTTSASRCSSLWDETNIEGIYYCEDREMYRACDRLSSTRKTCYHMEDIDLEMDITFFANGENYTCSFPLECYTHCKAKDGSFAYYGELRNCKK